MVPLELSTGPAEGQGAVKWLFAIGMAALAVGLARLLAPLLDTYTLLPDVAAVVLVAWFAGLRPALLTTAVAVLGTLFFVLPPHNALELPDVADAVRLGALVIVSLIVSWASHSLRAARLHAEARTRDVQRLLTDVSEQAAALERQAVELEQQIEASTIALEKLERSERFLQESNRELAVTTNAIAHDLRSPLRAIDGYSAMVASQYAGQLDAPARKHLERIRHNVQRMGLLMDGLLSLARLGKGDVVMENVDLSALARDVFRMQADAEPSRRVRWSVQSELRATADPRLVSLLLQNLIGNAWKFTRRREPAVISVSGEGTGRDTVFTIRDNGIGFDMQHAGQLFRAFQRLHNDAEFEGTGIGLATARRIVERHGGRIWAESRVGEGTVMRFTLSPSNREIAAPEHSSAEGEDVGIPGKVHSAGGGQSG